MKTNIEKALEQLSEIEKVGQTYIETIQDMINEAKQYLTLAQNQNLFKISIRDNITNYANMFKYKEKIIFLSKLFDYKFENNESIIIYLNRKIIEFTILLNQNETLKQYLEAHLSEQDFDILVDAVEIAKQANNVIESKQEVQDITPVPEIEDYIETHLKDGIVLNKLNKKNKFMLVRTKEEIAQNEEKYKLIQPNYQMFSMFSYGIYSEDLLNKLSEIEELETISYVDDQLKNELSSIINEKGIVKKKNEPKPIKASLFGG